MTAQAAEPEARWLLGSKHHDLERAPRLEPRPLERRQRLEGTQDPDDAVVPARVRDRVRVGTRAHRGQARLGPGPAGEDVADRVLPDGQACVAGGLADLLALRRPVVMGILNVTPDSFSDGGAFLSAAAALAHAERMVLDGADIIDIGAESSRPYGNAIAVSAEEERRRLEIVLPAAVHVPTPTHEMEYNELEEAPIDWGASWIDHAVPFQRSITGVTPPARF